jgi:hypothetical protein
MAGPKKNVFVAYASRDEPHADTILEAVRRANALAQPYDYHPWLFNDVPGEPLISPILENIDESAFVIADVTFLNLNVVYEVGYGIGKKKRVFLVRSNAVDGDKALATTTGIFDTLGYYAFDDAHMLANRLAAHIEERHLDIDLNLDRQTQVYIVEPPTRGMDATVMISRVKKAGYRYRSFTPDEDARLSATDAIRQVGVSSGIVLMLQAEGVVGSDAHNIRTMFVAGLAEGMGKPTLILTPYGYTVPIDIRDDAKVFRTEADIISAVGEFVPSIVAHFTQTTAPPGDHASLLQSISIGDPRAENEMTTLELYYLKTDQYERAVRGEVNLVVGRKGSGKTALFIRARDKTRADKRNIMVDLKPEGYQLIKLKEDILEYLAEGARQHLITAFWEYLILLEVAYKLLEKDRPIYRYNHEIHDLYLELNQTYNAVDFATQGDFSERLLMLSNRLCDKYRERFGTRAAQKLTNADVTELLYSHDLATLQRQICAYLEKKRAVWVFFDNLDKGWSTQGVEVVDAIVLRCLVDAGRKVEREMRKNDHQFHCIVFVRNDVYDHVMRQSPDYGKEMRATLDWSDPEMLRELLRLRLVSSLPEKDQKNEFFTIWQQLCESHYVGEESSAYLIERSLMRPRNLLKIFNHCRGFATTFQRKKITADDITKGLLAYSHDLIEELDRELTDVFPAARDLLYHFLDARAIFSAVDLAAILTAAKIESADHERVIDFLLYYGVMGIHSVDHDYFIFGVNYDLRQLKIRISRVADVRYIIHPAFWGGLSIEPPLAPDALAAPLVS